MPREYEEIKQEEQLVSQKIFAVIDNKRVISIIKEDEINKMPFSKETIEIPSDKKDVEIGDYYNDKINLFIKTSIKL